MNMIKNCQKETTDKKDKFVESKKEIIYPKYYELLIKRIIETYKNYGKNLKFNAYYNALMQVTFYLIILFFLLFVKNVAQFFIFI